MDLNQRRCARTDIEVSDVCTSIRNTGIYGACTSVPSFGVAVVSAPEDDFHHSEFRTTGRHTKVDGTKAGVTPKIIQVAPGKHMLEFSRDGFNTGHFPLEITPDDASGAA